ncbi:hypothetical protein FSP39_001772 [Pinctada imbricata]|uniref:receptor protein-tyrosine kinase n=1 Tax=Pinctada imbricata TaxID=66713 RepID=A0AA88XP63_PINIB|nr:hypothetical protein FSP39_001772 [Pinctada imbricata]
MFSKQRRGSISNNSRLQHPQQNTQCKNTEQKSTDRDTKGTRNVNEQHRNIKHKRLHINQRDQWATGADLGRPSATKIAEGVVGVYFSQSEYIFHLGHSSNVVGKVIALSNSSHSESCGPEFYQYSLNQRNGDASSLFRINETGFISCSGGNDMSDSKYNLTVNVLCRNGERIEVASTFATVLFREDACQFSKDAFKNDSDIAPIAQLVDGLCFQNKDLEFSVEENNDLVPIGYLAGCPFVNISTFALHATIFDVIDDTSEIVIKRQLDRESGFDLITSNVVCKVWFPEINVTLHRIAHLSVHIEDVNDNPIKFEVGERVRLGENHLITKATDKELRLVAVDGDKTPSKSYKFEVLENPHSACSQIHHLECHQVPKDKNYFPCSHVTCFLRTNVTKPPAGGKVNYKCTIALTDEAAARSKTNNGNKLSVIEVLIPPDEERRVVQVPLIYKKADVLSSAALYSTIYDASNDVKGNSSRTLYNIKYDPTRAFSITFKSGIVYIDNLEYFRRIGNHRNITIESAYPTRKIILAINVIKDPSKQRRKRVCNETCSKFTTKESCESSCGLGAKFGNCLWRRGDKKSMTRNFSTCVPQMSTCLDGKCDELESIHFLLCPQDCTSVIKGEGQYYENGKGIARGTSPCWCDYNGECSCLRDHANAVKSIQKYRQAVNQSMLQTMSSSYSLNAEEIENNKSEKQNKEVDIHPKVGAQTSETFICDWDCRTTIAATVGCVGAMLCIIVLTWRLRKFRCRSRHAIKHVSSSGSISAVPSDYMDDRDYRTSHSSPHWSPKRTIDFSQTIDDNKWEVPREKLILDKTLGEGEFGRVVKAVAYNLGGKDGYKEVAVKMLKNCASSSELQDLLSEYNLLQDVNHPNVIRLLGACTRDGPFYVIVEYCEHGSLLHYLRRSRLEENGYVNHRYRRYFRRKSGEQEGGEMEILNIRDLLSFAWQIAKGMRYLSEIKLVHRDLAARNVLVGTGKVLKISDFGLTRDVYEADTYLKRSKGRIPVKWLAPESLYAQIYTTQSDVWSFGIVLWEIVTLGAPPYPGIPPERLYNLLIAGYRMDRPEGCSDELYAVMQKCWKTDPADRPNFANLADIFDKMLQQRTEYLELTGGFEDNNSELFERQNNENTTLSSSGEEEIQYGSINSNNANPYLTPATSINRKDIFIDKSERAILANSRNNKNAPSSNTDNCIDSENVALLLDSRSAIYSNSSESDEELTVRQTGIVQTIA